MNNSEEESSSAVNDYRMKSHEKDLNFTPKNMSVTLGQSSSVRPTDFYIHSLIFDPIVNTISNERVREAKICDKLCKVSCAQTDGVCPFGMEFKDKIDLSVISLGKDLENIVQTVPMFRKLSYNDKTIKNDVIVNEYLLNFDLIVDDLENYNIQHKVNQNLLFALNSKKYSNLSGLKLKDMVPRATIDSSLLSMRIELCDNKKQMCKKELILEYGYFDKIKKESFKILLEQDKTIHRLSVAIYVNSEVERKGNDVQNTKLMILVKQNNEIIYNSPLNPHLHSAITTETYIYNHPKLSNFNLDIVNPNINKLFWEYKNTNTVYGADKTNSFCEFNVQFTHSYCENCLDSRCLKCSDNSYLTKEGNCEPSKLYIQEDENGNESYSEGV